MKKNENGFGLIAILVPIIMIVAAGFAGWYVWQKNKTESSAKVTSRANPNTTPDKSGAPETTRTATAKEELENQDQLLRNHVSRLVAGVVEYASNNNGIFPQDLVGVRAAAEVDGKPVQNVYRSWKNAGPITQGKPEASTFYYATFHTCDPTNNLMSAGGTKRMSAVVVQMPSGAAYCTEN